MVDFMEAGLLKAKQRLQSRPLGFKNPRTSAIVGAAKPIAGRNAVTRQKPVETDVIARAYLGKKAKATA